MPFQVIAKKTSKTVGELSLYGEIGASWFSEGIEAKKVQTELKKLTDDGATALTVYINSVGGSVFEGMAIHNILKRFDGKVTVVVDGLAASIASIITMAGAEIHMASASMMMIHEPRTYAGGTSKIMRDTAARLEKIRDQMVSVYAERTGRTDEDIKKMMADETWMTADEAVKEKFADKKVAADDEETEMKMVASASPLLAMYSKIPDHFRAIMARATAAPRPTEERKMDLTILASALGLPANATEADILACIQRNKGAAASQSDINELLAIAGKSTVAEAKGAILAMKQSHDQVATLQEEKRVSEKTRLAEKVTATVDAAVRDGKIIPAQREFWLTQGQKDVAMLDAFLASAPVLGGANPVNPVDPVPSGQGAGGIIQVSEAEQEKMFASMGITDPAEKAKVRKNVTAQSVELSKAGIRLSNQSLSIR